ncbi:Arachidonate 5-lipoxygenase [Branchiostoma belcheri]|nr:Arachidonate 5-lipoxygenase [Branchiostoma belcheri]
MEVVLDDHTQEFPTRYNRESRVIDLKRWQKAMPLLRQEHMDILVKVKTGNYFGAGTNQYVYINIRSKDGTESGDKKLDMRFHDDHESGTEEEAGVKTRGSNLLPNAHPMEDWFCSSLYVQLQPEDNGPTYYFPVHRWLTTGSSVWLVPGGCVLPQDEKHPEQRKAELKVMRERYASKTAVEGLLPVLKELHAEARFSKKQRRAMEGSMAILGFENVGIIIGKLFHKDGPWESFDSISQTFPSGKVPKGVTDWKTDENFGRQRLTGVNPTSIRLCTEIQMGKLQ